MSDILNSLNAELNSLYGDSVIVPASKIKLGPIHPSGSLCIDAMFGIGGLPRGAVISIAGLESSGKTTLSLALALQSLKLFKDKSVYLVDSENGLSTEYLQNLGFDTEDPRLNIIVPPFGTMETCIDIMQKLMQTGEVSCIVFDSIAAANEKKRVEAEVGDALIGNKAKLLSNEMSRLRELARKKQCTLIMINQLRSKIGFMQSGHVAPGGHAVDFYADLILWLKKAYGKHVITQKDEILGGFNEVKIKKNKICKGKGKFLIPIIDGEGISLAAEVVSIGVELEIIVKKGAWYKINDTAKTKDMTALGNGLVKTLQFLKDNPDILADLKTKIETKLNGE